MQVECFYLYFANLRSFEFVNTIYIRTYDLRLFAKKILPTGC